MSPVTHWLASWVVAAYATRNPRDVRLVTLIGVLPDADGAGLLVDLGQRLLGGAQTDWYAQYHHFWLHGLPAGLALAAIAAALARERWRVLFAALTVFHLHLLCDLVGSRGPSDVDFWPIFYSGPVSKNWMWFWKGQWALDAWPNRLISVALLVWVIALAVRLGHSPVILFNRKADAAAVAVLCRWRSQLRKRWRSTSMSGSDTAVHRQ